MKVGSETLCQKSRRESRANYFAIDMDDRSFHRRFCHDMKMDAVILCPRRTSLVGLAEKKVAIAVC